MFGKRESHLLRSNSFVWKILAINPFGMTILRPGLNPKLFYKNNLGDGMGGGGYPIAMGLKWVVS